MSEKTPKTVQQMHSPDGPVFFTHSALSGPDEKIRHGFFSRKGGVSTGLYDSLNCGFGSNDQPEHIQLNRARVCASLNLLNDRLLGLYQTHSADCLIIEDFPDKNFADGARPHADGLVTRLDKIGLAVLGADCLPVLFADHKEGVIGACHAGWRGALGGIIENTVDAMCQIGANLSDIVMVIGPGIHKESYQIGADMAAEIQRQKPDSNACFMPDATMTAPSDSPSHYLFDLPLFAQQAGYAAGLNQIHTLPYDTYQQADLFFSHRRATHKKEADSGRLISVITKN